MPFYLYILGLTNHSKTKNLIYFIRSRGNSSRTVQNIGMNFDVNIIEISPSLLYSIKLMFLTESSSSIE